MRQAVFRIFSIFCITSVSLFLSSCAYRVGTADRRLPDGATLVSIPVFKNRTHDAGIEVHFTNALIRELERSQVAKVVPRAEAQVSLEGVVVSVSYSIATQSIGNSGSGFIPPGTVLNTEYRVVAKTLLELRRLSDGKLLWTQDIEGERSYLAPKIGVEGLNSANALYNHSARYENISAMATDMMAQAYGRLTENF